MTNDTHTIEVSERTYRRFELHRERTKTESIPEMDPDTFLDTLLDVYDGGETGNADAGDWRDDLQTRSEADAADDGTCPKCDAPLTSTLGAAKACPNCGWVGS